MSGDDRGELWELVTFPVDGPRLQRVLDLRVSPRDSSHVDDGRPVDGARGATGPALEIVSRDAGARRVVPSSSSTGRLDVARDESSSAEVRPVATPADTTGRVGPAGDWCGWCRGPLPPRARFGPPRAFCGKACRQASSRFGLRVERREAEALDTVTPKRLAVADPPYPGKSGLYVGHPDYAGEVDVRGLVDRLQAFDGWALATSGASALDVYDVCRAAGVRPMLAPWVRGRIRPGRARGAAEAWEAVFYVPARESVSDAPPPSALVCGSRPWTSNPGRVVGAKPPDWSAWVFALIGARPCDHLADLFPGSGLVSRAWDVFRGGP